MVRRILPVVVVVGLPAAGTTWFAKELIQLLAEPRRHEAVASLRVLPNSGTGTGTADYEKYRRTHVQFITSPQLEETSEKFEKVAKEVTKLSYVMPSAELEAQRRELDSLEESAYQSSHGSLHRRLQH